jgi:hypothetical protein
MACRTGVCGMRRFDGHGASSYRPTNPEAAKEQSAALRSLLAERERQDAGLFGSVQKATPAPVVSIVNTSISGEAVGPCYSLSDSNGT